VTDCVILSNGWSMHPEAVAYYQRDDARLGIEEEREFWLWKTPPGVPDGTVRPYPAPNGQSAIVYPSGVDFPLDYHRGDMPPYMAEYECRRELGINERELYELVRTGRLRWAVEFVRAGGTLHPQLEAIEEGLRHRAEVEHRMALARHAEATEPTPAPTPEPSHMPSARHLYAVEIVGVGTKIGITDKPRHRIATHMAAARAHGRETGRIWISYRHAEAETNEAALLASKTGRRKSEYLRVPFGTVMRRIARLPMTRAVTP